MQSLCRSYLNNKLSPEISITATKIFFFQYPLPPLQATRDEEADEQETSRTRRIGVSTRPNRMMNYSTSTLSQQPAAASGPNLTQQKSPTSSSSSSSASSRAPALTTAKQLKEEGNRLYMSHRYKEAIDMYTKALEKSPHPVYLTNRALCYLKLQQWNDCVTDCKRSIDLATSSKNTHDSTNHLHHHASSVKPYFYMGQALCELERFDEGIEALQLAHETSKQMNEYYGDEITR